jgi:hypothetical protein
MRVREQGLAVESILDACDTVQSQQTHLSTLNDDWIVAGVDLGILKDIVIFGVERRPRDLERNCSVQAYDGERHRIAFAELPGSALHPPDGDLINSCRTPQQTTLGEILGWSYHQDRDQYWFSDAPEPIALDFDLDCFHAEWRGHLFAWPEKLFVSEFIESMEYFGTVGLNGKRVVEGLVEQAGLITIAREPGCCGGEQESDSIFARLNHVVFNDGIAAVR